MLLSHSKDKHVRYFDMAKKFDILQLFMFEIHCKILHFDTTNDRNVATVELNPVISNNP